MDRDGDGHVSLDEKAVHFESVWRAETRAGSLVEFEPRYEAMVKWGISVSADEVAQVRNGEDFDHLIATALERRTDTPI